MTMFVVPGVYEAHKANSGAISFQVRYPLGFGSASLTLASKDNPELDLYQITFGPANRFIDRTNDREHETRDFELHQPIDNIFREFWLSWHSGYIRLFGQRQADPILCYPSDNLKKQKIGYVKLYKKSLTLPVEWQIDSSPVILPSIKEVKFQDGQLKWINMQLDSNPQLPKDALIGGFEDEPLYIARAICNRSLCPGKYYNSRKTAYVAWGGREHRVRNIEILTGYNAAWVQTKDNYIPENAFVAGFSEVRREPLYIGRAMHDGNLLVGKIHTLYKTCYLPYMGKEIEAYAFEILVRTDVDCRGVHGNLKSTSS